MNTDTKLGYQAGKVALFHGFINSDGINHYFGAKPVPVFIGYFFTIYKSNSGSFS
jgi:hypothetical protein